MFVQVTVRVRQTTVRLNAVVMEHVIMLQTAVYATMALGTIQLGTGVLCARQRVAQELMNHAVVMASASREVVNAILDGQLMQHRAMFLIVLVPQIVMAMVTVIQAEWYQSVHVTKVGWVTSVSTLAYMEWPSLIRHANVILVTLVQPVTRSVMDLVPVSTILALVTADTGVR